jgi:hypothetical protein
MPSDDRTWSKFGRQKEEAIVALLTHRSIEEAALDRRRS